MTCSSMTSLISAFTSCSLAYNCTEEQNFISYTCHFTRKWTKSERGAAIETYKPFVLSGTKCFSATQKQGIKLFLNTGKVKAVTNLPPFPLLKIIMNCFGWVIVPSSASLSWVPPPAAGRRRFLSSPRSPHPAASSAAGSLSPLLSANHRQNNSPQFKFEFGFRTSLCVMLRCLNGSGQVNGPQMTCSAISCLLISSVLCCSLVWSIIVFPPTNSLLSIVCEQRRVINDLCSSSFLFFYFL